MIPVSGLDWTTSTRSKLLPRGLVEIMCIMKLGHMDTRMKNWESSTVLRQNMRNGKTILVMTSITLFVHQRGSIHLIICLKAEFLQNIRTVLLNDISNPLMWSRNSSLWNKHQDITIAKCIIKVVFTNKTIYTLLYLMCCILEFTRMICPRLSSIQINTNWRQKFGQRGKGEGGNPFLCILASIQPSVWHH